MIENQNLQENKVEEQKNIKSNNWITILLVLIIVLLLGYIILDKIKDNNSNTDDNLNNNSTTNDDIAPITYRIEKKELIKYDYRISYDEVSGYGKLEKTDEAEYIEYVILQGGDESVKKINTEIQNNINKIIGLNKENYYPVTVTKNGIKNEECCYIKEKDDGTMLNYRHIDKMNYRMIEHENYYLLIETHVSSEYRGSGFGIVLNVYTIDKKLGKAVSNTEVINSIKNISELKTKLIQNVGEHFEDTEQTIFQKKDKDEHLSQLKKKINENDFLVYYNEFDRLVFSFKNLGEWTFLEYIYDEELGFWYANY